MAATIKPAHVVEGTMAMAGTPVLVNQDTIPIEESFQQVQKIVGSATFRARPALQTLLRYLSAKALEGVPEEVKEYTIGVEVMGRRPDFDPKNDPIVRVQVFRLRQKLKEYYDREGTRDSILVQIPKGHYLPRFEAAPRSSAMSPVAAVEAPRNPDAPGHAEDSTELKPGFRTQVILVCLLIAAFGAGYWTDWQLHHRQSSTAAADQTALSAKADPAQAFWAPFIKEDPAPIIAYADAMFLLDDSSDLYRFRHGASYDRGAPVDRHLARQFAANPQLASRAGPLFYDNGYTGTGELQAVGMLMALFTKMGATPTLESSFDLTTGDLSQHNVILLGSPFQNVAVEQLPPSGDFVFVDPADVHGLWAGRIENKHPVADEKTIYRTERDPVSHIVKADYALISFLPGVAAGRHIVTLGGLDTTGTQGAVMLATSKQGIEQLTKELSREQAGTSPGRIPAFQALLQVNLEKGYQVLNTRLLAVHQLPSENQAAHPSAH